MFAIRCASVGERAASSCARPNEYVRKQYWSTKHGGRKTLESCGSSVDVIIHRQATVTNKFSEAEEAYYRKE